MNSYCGGVGHVGVILLYKGCGYGKSRPRNNNLLLDVYKTMLNKRRQRRVTFVIIVLSPVSCRKKSSDNCQVLK